MVGEQVERGLYLLKIHPHSVNDYHDKQLNFTHPTEGGQDYQVNLALVSSISPGLSTWHRRLAHVNYQTIFIKMASSGVVDGLDLANTIIPSTPCAGCAYGKHQRSPFPTGCIRATYTGQLIHSDLCGPMEKSAPNGCLYFALFINDYSGLFRFIFFLKTKSEAADRFKDLINIIRRETGNLVRTFPNRCGGEWSSNEFEAWLTRKGIRHETSLPHTPQQDGVSERAIRTVTEGARSCLHDCFPPSDHFEGEVISGTKRLVEDGRLPTYL